MSGFFSGGGGSGAPTDSPFITRGNVAGLSAERDITNGSGIIMSDTGANGQLIISANYLLDNDNSGYVIERTSATAHKYKLSITSDGEFQIKSVTEDLMCAQFGHAPGFGSVWRFDSAAGGLRLRDENNVEVWALGVGGNWQVYNLASVTFGEKIYADGVLIAAEPAGESGKVAFTNTVNNDANSTGVGSIKFKGATSRDSSGFLKILDGTTARYIPYFDEITG